MNSPRVKELLAALDAMTDVEKAGAATEVCREIADINSAILADNAKLQDLVEHYKIAEVGWQADNAKLRDELKAAIKLQPVRARAEVELEDDDE